MKNFLKKFVLVISVIGTVLLLGLLIGNKSAFKRNLLNTLKEQLGSIMNKKNAIEEDRSEIKEDIKNIDEEIKDIDKKLSDVKKKKSTIKSRVVGEDLLKDLIEVEKELFGDD